MKKRILLVLIIGISFAPPVVAFSGYNSKQCTTGELTESCIDHRGTQCELEKMAQKIESQNAGTAQSNIKSGSAQQ